MNTRHKHPSAQVTQDVQDVQDAPAGHTRRRALLSAAGATAAAMAAPLAGCAAVPVPALPHDALLEQVRQAEIAFARSMAERRLDMFASHIADDAVFINGGSPLRGRAAIVAHWTRFFEAQEAPFSWRPEVVELQARGDLGYTEGPVSTPQGVAFARFWTTWRREADGRWLVVFDSGQRLCRDARQ